MKFRLAHWGACEDPKGATDVARERDEHLHDAYRR
jgi:hypothetical protein